MSRTLIFLLALLTGPLPGYAQPVSDTSRSDSTDVYEHLERLVDEPASDTPTQYAAESLTALIDNPFDLNRATAADLSTIPPLSLRLARRIVRYRKTHGPFSTLDQIAAVEGIEQGQLQSFRPYLQVNASSLDTDGEENTYPSIPSVEAIFSDLDLNLIQRATRTLDPGRGFDNDTTRSTFKGSPARLTTRLRVRSERRAQIAFTLDKDPGEALRWHPQSETYGFDHIAGNLALHDIGRLETLVVGDFTVQYGQGVSLWQGLSFGKGRAPVSPLVREGRGIVPFQSTSEDRFFRGAATTISVTPALSASAFVSRRRRDATLDSSSAGENESQGSISVRTLSSGGRHRTENELARKNAVGITTVGGALEHRTGPLHLGVTGYKTRLDRPLHPPDAPYRRFDRSGTQFAMVSAFGSAVLSNYTVFSEVARTATGSFGGVVGAALNHEGGVQALLLARRFPPTFDGLYNGAVGESSSTQNETGIYTGLRIQIAERWQWTAYVDQYQFPWLRFSVPRPTRGIDTRTVLEYDPRPWLSSYLQLRAEWEERGTKRSDASGRSLHAVESYRRHSARWHTEYTFSDALTLRSRIQLSRFSTETTQPSHGVLLFQGLRLRLGPSLRIDARLAFFDTDGFESRIYAYEHDLLYSFSVPVLYDRGRRSYVLAQYKATSQLTLEAKYGVTWYPHRRTIGSGLNATQGNQVRELRFQIRWNL